MAEDQNTKGEELFYSPADEEGSPIVSTTDDQTEESESSSEENKEALILDESKADPAAKARLDQVAAWRRKIDMGEKTLDDLPKHQAWIKKDLEAQFGREAKKQEVEADYDIESIVEEKLKAKEADKKFSDMKAALNDTKLSSEERATISEEFKDLLDSGLSKDKALEKAIKLAKVDLNFNARRKAMVPPRAGNTQKSEDQGEYWKKADPQARLDKLKSLTSSGKFFK